MPLTPALPLAPALARSPRLEPRQGRDSDPVRAGKGDLGRVDLPQPYAYLPEFADGLWENSKSSFMISIPAPSAHSRTPRMFASVGSALISISISM
jgi:hypothetical protein